MDNKKISLLTLCDLSKAFDSVSHSILLKKCAKLSIDCFWFNSYMSNRTQSVKLQDTTSLIVNVNFGVPQGSILGPILFTVYVHDMAEYFSECTLVQYADDTQFLHSGSLEDFKTMIKEAERTLVRARQYFLCNGLMVNPNKTQCIFIGNRQLLARIPEDAVVRFGNTSIQPSTHVKNLGLHMDKYLLFDVHINEISKKVIGLLIYLNRISMNFDKASRKIVVQTLVLSHINYCIRIWGTTNTTLLQKVQKLQNFAARVAVGGLRKYDHVSPAYKELGWVRIKQKHLMDVSIAMHKVVSGMCPAWLHSFPTVHTNTNSVTRQQRYLAVPRTKTDTGAKAFLVNGPKLWNSLPREVINTNSLSAFKSRLTRHILRDSNAL